MFHSILVFLHLINLKISIIQGVIVIITLRFPPCIKVKMPASVAQLNARPTADQEVSGLTPAVSATFFRGDLIMKYFLRSFSPFH